MRNWTQTILSQYADSPRLLALLESLDDWISPDTNFEAFHTHVWNILTATGYGLDVWGRIVGVRRVVQIAEGSFFGFKEAIDRTGFDQAPFYNGQQVLFPYTLDDESYRRLIFAKAALNITNCSVPAINRILLDLFPGRGNCYVIDGRNAPWRAWFGFNEARDRESFGHGSFDDLDEAIQPGNMTMTYVFEFPLEPFEIAIVSQSGVLPKSTGVLADVRYPH